MTDISKTGETRSFKLKKGVDNKLSINKAVKFIIRTTGGSVIKGVITANNPLIVNPGDDITEYNVEIDDEINKKPDGI